MGCKKVGRGWSFPQSKVEVTEGRIHCLFFFSLSDSLVGKALQWIKHLKPTGCSNIKEIFNYGKSWGTARLGHIQPRFLVPSQCFSKCNPGPASPELSKEPLKCRFPVPGLRMGEAWEPAFQLAFLTSSGDSYVPYNFKSTLDGSEQDSTTSLFSSLIAFKDHNSNYQGS